MPRAIKRARRPSTAKWTGFLNTRRHIGTDSGPTGKIQALVEARNSPSARALYLSGNRVVAL